MQWPRRNGRQSWRVSGAELILCSGARPPGTGNDGGLPPAHRWIECVNYLEETLGLVTRGESGETRGEIRRPWLGVDRGA